MMIVSFSTGIAAAMVLGLFSCSMIDQEIDLIYEGPPGKARAPIGEVAVVVGNSSQMIQRDGKSWVIGNVKNGVGIETTDLLTQDDPYYWVAAALATELQAVGFVAPLFRQPPSTGLWVNVDLQNFWVEQDTGVFSTGAISNITILYSLYQGDVLIAALESTKSRNRDEFNASPMAGALGVAFGGQGSAENKAISISNCLRSTLLQAIPELITFIETTK